MMYGTKCNWYPRFKSETDELIQNWKLQGLGMEDLMRLVSLLIHEREDKK